MSDMYTGNRDVILELPQSHDVYHIDWIAIFCYVYGVNFGLIRVANLSSRIPPYVPLQKKVSC